MTQVDTNEASLSKAPFTISDLTPYAGKDVHLAFRHYDCTGQYILRLDDVFIFEKGKADPTGITAAAAGSAPARVEYYSLGGERLSAPARGVTIVRTTMADGTVTTRKMITK